MTSEQHIELRVKHLELVQGAIDRMAKNQFLLKGWSIAVIAGVVSLASPGSDPRFLVIAMVASVAFWGLDAYYLALERRFRELHDALARGVGGSETVPPLFSMSIRPVGREAARCWFRPCVLFSHGPLFVVLIALAIVELG